MAEDIRWVKTHCARMDHGGCTLLVGVQDNKIVKIKGDLLTLRWRDFPDEPTIARRRNQVALFDFGNALGAK